MLTAAVRIPLRFPLAGLLCLALLAGCASRPPVLSGDRAAAWIERRVRLSGLHEWGLSGRIAVQMEHDAFSASLYWQQRGGEYTIRVVAPLGRGTYELYGAPGGVRLLTADGRQLSAPDAGALMRDNLGWELPVSGLAWWIRGLPEPNSAASDMSVDGQGRLNRIRQNGWDVVYRRYAPGGAVELPDKMELGNARLKVRLVINEWDLDP